MEDLAIIFSASVQFADSVDHLEQRDAATVVADGDLALGEVDFYFNLFAEPRGVFVDGVIDDLLDEDVDAVVVRGAVAQFADVHAGTEAYMFHVLEVDDGVVVVFDRG